MAAIEHLMLRSLVHQVSLHRMALSGPLAPPLVTRSREPPLMRLAWTQASGNSRSACSANSPASSPSAMTAPSPPVSRQPHPCLSTRSSVRAYSANRSSRSPLTKVIATLTSAMPAPRASALGTCSGSATSSFPRRHHEIASRMVVFPIPGGMTMRLTPGSRGSSISPA